ncbi:glycosyltransferase family 4 protein [Pontiellaceae bacterium B1224]|nr:glycosyltransferase family 4 protein [Pontiellaceae bacterium B1224]
MRILNIIQCSNLGGMEQSTLESLVELKAIGHEVKMLSLHPAGKLKSIATDRGIPLVGAPRYCLGGMGTIPWLLRNIRQFNPERILLTGHNFGSLVAAMLSKRKTYLSIHFHHGDRSIWLWRGYYALAKRGCLGIRFISSFIFKEVESLFADYRNVACFPNIFREPETYVDILKARQRLNLPEDAYIVGNAGWLIPRKAFDVFLNVAAFVVKDQPKAFFLIAGDGEERGALEKLAHDLGISEKVRFIGWQKDLSHFYAALNVLLFNSRFDALGRTPVEALIHSVPVVASVECGGLDEFVRHGTDGYLIDSHDVKALANEIVRLSRDTAACSAVAESGRCRVLELGSPSQHVKALIQFLDLI